MAILWLSWCEEDFKLEGLRTRLDQTNTRIVSDQAQLEAAISLRDQIYSSIVVIYHGKQNTPHLHNIRNVISVVYGRSKRPVFYYVENFKGGKLGVQKFDENDVLLDMGKISIADFEKDLLLTDSAIEAQPTDYMLERNALAEPAWLVNTVNTCFDDLDGTEIPFPDLTDEDMMLREMLQSRNFNSPSLSEEQALKSIYYIFDDLNVFDELGIDREIFKQFLLVLKKNYKPNPYHNFHHAVDVLQFAYLLLKSSPELLESLSLLEFFSMLLASIGHDVGHTSYNNHFHCQNESLISVLFNDQSVLEMYHLLKIFAILRHPRYNFCSGWPQERWILFRKTVIACVLGTDMSAHFKYLKQFSDAQLSGGRELDENARLLLPILIIKCADISNVIRPFDVARRWGFKLVSEFFCQGDWERFLGKKPSFITDRLAYDLAQIQEHFMLQVAGPLFRFSAEAFPGTSFCIEALESNVECWRTWVPETDEIIQASTDFAPYIRSKP